MKGVLHKDEDLAVQHRTWKAQTAGCICMCLFVLAAFLGLMGGRWLGHAARSHDGLQIEYDRFGRIGATSRIRIQLDNPDVTNRFVLTGNLFERAESIQITPNPVRSEAGSDGIAVWIAADETAPRALTLIEYKPVQPGKLMATIQAGTATPARLEQFVYP